MTHMRHYSIVILLSIHKGLVIINAFVSFTIVFYELLFPGLYLFMFVCAFSSSEETS